MSKVQNNLLKFVFGCDKAELLSIMTVQCIVKRLVTFAIPPCVIEVLGVAAGTVGELTLKLGYVPVIEVVPFVVKTGGETPTIY